jgi:hypothetical protein
MKNKKLINFPLKTQVALEKESWTIILKCAITNCPLKANKC